MNRIFHISSLKKLPAFQRTARCGRLISAVIAIVLSTGVIYGVKTMYLFDFRDALVFTDDKPVLEVVHLRASESWRKCIVEHRTQGFRAVPVF